MTDQTQPDIIYTKVDEAPELASASLLPVHGEPHHDFLRISKDFLRIPKGF